jgi:5-oxopent-3-ene-1,2,5-tricarboxylate decarboxylase / 2-hydroxyhepta-2,4-diene-1,7-dioate isomerase
MSDPISRLRFDVPPFELSGRIYGVLLNHRSAIAAVGAAAEGPPYKGAPKAPVLYIKPRNTLAVNGQWVPVPIDASELEVGACLGVVIGRPACHLRPQAVMDHIAGYLIVNDISVPHTEYYRPSIRLKARDGFCPLGPCVTPRQKIENPNQLTVRVFVDGQIQQTASTADLVRPIEQLLADITEFMTLSPGDVVAVGAAAPQPRARPGQKVAIEIDHLGRIENPFARVVS